MPDYSRAPTLYLPHGPTITTLSQESMAGRLLQAGTFGTGTGWPVANKALFFPIDILEPFLIAKAFTVFGATPTGNFDWGWYDAAGNRLASTGSIAVTATTDLQAAALAYNVLPSQDAAYLAAACDSASTLLYRTNSFSAIEMAAVGVREMASAFPLPSTATFADMTHAYLPVIGISKRSTI